MKIQKQSERQSESGSLLVYILIAVALFAALAMAVARDERGSTQDISSQQAKIYASEILDYANVIGDAVSELRLGGCAAEDLSFDATFWGHGDYLNANSPADKSCHVFDSAGGAAKYVTPSDDINGGTDWEFSGSVHLYGVGTTDAVALATAPYLDLVMYLPGVNESICAEINEKLGIKPSVPTDGGDMNPLRFAGVFSVVSQDSVSGSVAATIDSSQPLYGKTSGCFQEESGGKRHIFYHTLLAR